MQPDVEPGARSTAPRAWAPAVVVMALVGLFTTGCPARHVRSYPPPSGESLLAAVRARQAIARALNLDTRTTSNLGGDRVRATVLMLVDRPGRLRFEAEISLKGTVAALATDGLHFGLLEIDARLYRHGPACPRNVAALVQIPLAPHAIAAILLGDAPLTEAAVVRGVRWDAERGAEILEVVTPGARAERGALATARLWITLQRREKEQTYAVLGVEGEEPGTGERWRVAFEDLRFEHGVFFPDKIAFAEPGHSFESGVAIDVHDRRVNPEFPDAAFQLEVPAGFTSIAVGCEPTR